MAGIRDPGAKGETMQRFMNPPWHISSNENPLVGTPRVRTGAVGIRVLCRTSRKRLFVVGVSNARL
jgi:hypothetical protein